jgi:hypothetical protein
MRGRRLWLKVAAHGGSIPVYVTKDPIIDENGDECDAYWDREDNEIVIRAYENISVMKQRLHHELLHVCFGAHTGQAREDVLGGATPEARDDREEKIVGFIEPIQFDILVRNGWLKYPNPPKFRVKK